MVTSVQAAIKVRFNFSPDQLTYIRNNYHLLSNSEMAAELNTSVWTIQQLLKQLQLVKTPEQRKAIHIRRNVRARNSRLRLVMYDRQDERDNLVKQYTSLFNSLGFGELPLFWRMYKQGVKKSEMCRYWNIRETHCMECLEVCEMIWGRGPRKMAVPEPEPPTVGDAKNLREEPAATTPLIRPPAVYSNRSPYGIASPGM